MKWHLKDLSIRKCRLRNSLCAQESYVGNYQCEQLPGCTIIYVSKRQGTTK